VTIVPKNNHPNRHRIIQCDNAFAVDGRPGAVLNLKRGRTYLFKIIQTPDHQGRYAHSLFFTDDHLGGPRGMCSDRPEYQPAKIPGSPSPISDGVVSLNVTDKTPDYIYYQDSQHVGLGGMITVSN